MQKELKIAGLLLVCATILLGVDLYIIYAGSERSEENERRPRFAAEVSTLIRPKSEANLRAKSINVSSKNPGGAFRLNREIIVECALENNLNKTLTNFKSVIRTPSKEIAALKTKTLAANKEINLSGSFVPENTGVFIIACRGDVEREIEENNENDNREVAVIYVVE